MCRRVPQTKPAVGAVVVQGRRAEPAVAQVAHIANLREILTDVEDLRYKISIPRAIRSVGAPMGVTDSENFTTALIRIRAGNDLYQVREGMVDLEESTLFSAAQTLALTVHARERGVSLATLVFWALHRMVMHDLADGDGGRWLYPVNLRGALNLGDDERNHVGGFYVPLRRDVSPEQIQRELRRRLRNADHWWLWHQARYACWLGQPVINRIYRSILMRPGHLGSFSSLGEWQLDFHGSALPPGTRIAPCGPGSPNHPVANGIVVCNGELIMSLRLDPVLGRTDAERDACLARWRGELLALLEQRPAQTAVHGEPAP